MGEGADARAKTATPPHKTASKSSVGHVDRDMGSALRSIYQRTIDEDIPDEMLSLLGKLD